MHIFSKQIAPFREPKLLLANPHFDFMMNEDNKNCQMLPIEYFNMDEQDDLIFSGE